MRKQAILKKKISRECWNLDYELTKWLNEHLKVYLKDASKIIDLEFYKFQYKGKEYTQLELIKELISITEILKRDHFTWEHEDIEKLKDDMYDILKLIHYTLWW